MRNMSKTKQTNKIVELCLRLCSYRKVWYLFIFGSFVFLANLIHKNTQIVPLDYYNRNINQHCIIPELDMDDKEISRFFWDPDPIQCSPPSLRLLFVDYDGFLRFNKSAMEISKLHNITCSYSIFVRTMADEDVEMQEEVQFSHPVYVPGDVFVVKCVDKKERVVYNNLHQNIHYKQVLESREIKEETQDQLSVFIFGVDSTSRLGAMKKLKKTMRYLHENLEAVTFKGHMKVGENTYPNVLPTLTGKKMEEVNIDYQKKYFDDAPFIWKNFSNAGYVTLMAEDWPQISAFNYLAKGFNKQPTDHYMRTFCLAMLKFKPLQYLVDQVSLFLEDKNINLKKTSSLCYGDRSKHSIYIEYYKRFMHAYKGKLKFAFSWLTEINHTYLNFLGLADDDFSQFFKWLKLNGHLNNSILIFMSDHGSRIDEIRNSAIGRMEVNMPLLSIVLPDHLKKKHPEAVQNFINNEKALTSHFDTYQLLSDILHQNFSPVPLPSTGKPPRGIGYLRKIPKTRTCADAGIPEHHCACYASRKLNVTDTAVTKVVSFLVEAVNDILYKERNKCEKLSLSYVKDARIIYSGLEPLSTVGRNNLRSYFFTPKDPPTRYSAMFQTQPGSAYFEGTAEIDGDGTTRVIGEIQRTNQYGNQSICINDRRLRLYCYCKYQPK